MRRVTIDLLVALHMAVVFGCHFPVFAAQVPARQLRAGAAASNITPELGVILDGTIMQIGPAKHIHDELHARCLVLDDGATRIAFAVCDTTMIAPEVVAHAKRLTEATTGLAPDHVLISATHTHSSPRAIDLGLGEANRRYNEFLAQRIADGIRRAINQLAPAKIGWGSAQKPEYVFNRRWFVKPEMASPSPFGGRAEQVAMNPARAAAVKPAGPVDPEVFVLSVQYADGRPLALLANYALHYVGGVPPGHISADYFGAFADRIEALLGADQQQPPFVGIMANGTCGDVSNIDLSKPPESRPAYAKMREVADGLAQEVLKVVRGIQYHNWVPLSARTSVLELGVRRPDAARLEWAREISAKMKADQRMSRPAIYAREALLLSQYPPTVSITLQAFRIGDLGIGAAPCEMFAETGLAIKKQSPFKATFIIELANGFSGYLPTPEQHGWGGYETWPARSSL
ncbi:neutral/alkaline non-lysosomal ceramidase N-terminal domain-containing protein, partial [Candidatus Sumerlaeota bacterium]|nr:neutral/alkaline non-lysosomal ceramidase N-terminal domain-containing protein [Candidatus Sumerlaeota bacterium]